MEDSNIDAGPSANDGSPDIFRLVKNSNADQVFLNDILIFDQPIVTTPSLTFHGSSDNDTLIVDEGAGDPTPSSGITFDGGAGTNTLSLFSTDGDDRVTVGRVGTNAAITLNNTSQSITLANTRNLFIQTGAGNDTVTIKDLSGTAVTGISVDLGSGNDLFNGSFSTTPLVVYAGAGTDVIYGGRGDAVIYGETGNKTIYGGIGNQVIYGATGTNLIVGGIGDAVIYGGTGSNTIFGGIGNAIIYGGTGNNTIYGGIGNEIIYGGNGPNTIYGGIGSQVLCGGTGPNTICGGIGTEAIYKGTGSTTITRGIGKETIYDASKKPTNLVSLKSSTAGSQVAAAFQQPQHAWLIDFLLNPLKNPVDVNGEIKIVL
jgi:Ca2+-binding RTX toxin-like protein